MEGVGLQKKWTLRALIVGWEGRVAAIPAIVTAAFNTLYRELNLVTYRNRQYDIGIVAGAAGGNHGWGCVHFLFEI